MLAEQLLIVLAYLGVLIIIFLFIASFLELQSSPVGDGS